MSTHVRHSINFIQTIAASLEEDNSCMNGHQGTKTLAGNITSCVKIVRWLPTPVSNQIL